MTEPVLTVAVLAVLWLIVLVPMFLQRRDARAGTRSAARFSSTMRVLSRGGVIDRPAPQPEAASMPTLNVSGVVVRRPVPASKESTMYEPDRFEMSEARRAMMARRRRSLAVLVLGLVLAFLLAIATGSVVAWLLTALFGIGLAAYLVSLQSQAKHDKARRQQRLERTMAATGPDYEATAELERFTSRPEAVVQIDADDVALDHFDTIDLTGLYSDDELRESSRDHGLRRAG
jgi:hypothetical protein